MILGHGGKEAGWDFIKKLYDNLDGKIVDSSGKCHKMVADGEFYVGITIEKSAINTQMIHPLDLYIRKTAPAQFRMVLHWLRDARTKRTQSCSLILLLQKNARLSRARTGGRRPVRSDMEVGASMAKLDDLVLVDYDFDWAANEKEANIEHFNDIMVD